MICLEEVAACFGNTSNLFVHLRYQHPLVYQDLIVERGSCSRQIQQRSEPSVAQSDMFARVKQLDHNSKEHKAITRWAVVCLA